MVSQEIVIIYWDEKHPTHVVIQNGSTEFYHLKRMNKDDVAELLGANKKQ